MSASTSVRLVLLRLIRPALSRTFSLTSCSALNLKPKFPKLCGSLYAVVGLGISRKMSSYTVEEKGTKNSLEWRVFFKNSSGSVVSPFHDIPLSPPGNSNSDVFNMVVEIPRWTNAKLEIKTSAKINPIMQDVKKNKLRFVPNCFPYHGYIWNYGALPQTWEDPSHVDVHTNCNGDNDPLDVCEIGSRVANTGDVIQVKVLGALAMIDEGETDWKILVIDVRDKLAPQLNDVQDIEEHMPGFLKATFEWFKIYKVPSGKPLNKFAFNDEPKDKNFALEIIKQTHEQWQQLMAGKTDPAGVACENVTVAGSAHLITAKEVNAIVAAVSDCGTPQALNPQGDAWHFVSQQ